MVGDAPKTAMSRDRVAETYAKATSVAWRKRLGLAPVGATIAALENTARRASHLSVGRPRPMAGKKKD